MINIKYKHDSPKEDQDHQLQDWEQTMIDPLDSTEDIHANLVACQPLAILVHLGCPTACMHHNMREEKINQPQR